MKLEDLNRLDMEIAREQLLQCCGSQNWVNAMLERRPYMNEAELHNAAGLLWDSLDESDWLEAFAKHPRIGDRIMGHSSPAATWSAQEQQGMNGAGADRAARMRELNRAYESKFGWIFIVCATGKSADEMMQLLEKRLANNAAEELRIAAAEQAKIMRLRLKKLLDE